MMLSKRGKTRDERMEAEREEKQRAVSNWWRRRKEVSKQTKVSSEGEEKKNWNPIIKRGKSSFWWQRSKGQYTARKLSAALTRKEKKRMTNHSQQDKSQYNRNQQLVLKIEGKNSISINRCEIGLQNTHCRSSTGEFSRWGRWDVEGRGLKGTVSRLYPFLSH